MNHDNSDIVATVIGLIISAVLLVGLVSLQGWLAMVAINAICKVPTFDFTQGVALVFLCSLLRTGFSGFFAAISKSLSTNASSSAEAS